MNKMWNYLRKLLPEQKGTAPVRHDHPARSAVTPARRFTSGLLAFVMVLGFLPAGLFDLLPKAKAAGNFTCDSVSISQNSDGSWHYEVTFSGGTKNSPLGNHYFALVPDVSASGSGFAPSQQIGTGLHTGISSAGPFETALEKLMGNGLKVSIKDVGTGLRFDSNGRITFSGDIPAAEYNSLKTAVAGMDTGSNPTTAGAIPMCAVLRTWSDPPTISGGVGEWADVSPAILTGRPITIDLNSITDGTTVAIPLDCSSGTADAVVNWGQVTVISDTTDHTDGTPYSVGNTGAISTTITSGTQCGASSSSHLQITVDNVTRASGPMSMGASITLDIPYTTAGQVKHAQVAVNFEIGYIQVSANPITFYVNEGDTTAQNAYAVLNVPGTVHDGLYHDDTNTGPCAWIGRTSELSQTVTENANVALTNAIQIHLNPNASWQNGQTISDTLQLPFCDMTMDMGADYDDDGNTTGYMGTINVPVQIVVGPPAVTRYPVAYDAQGGTVSPATENKGINEYFTLPTPTRSGYTFDGWYTAANGGGTKMDNSGATPNGYFGSAVFNYNDTTNKPPADFKLYAKWTAASTTRTVTFQDTSGDTNVTGIPNALTDTTTNASSTFNYPTEPSRPGYDFDGWDTDGNGTADWTSGNAFTTSATSVTATAVWTIKEYTVSFDAGAAGSNVGSGSMPATKNNVSHGTTISYSSLSVPTWTGHTFKGWATTSANATAGTVAWNATIGDPQTITSTRTYYAVWEDTNYTITYKPNSGSFTSGSNPTQDRTDTATATATVTLPKVTRDGYVFGGWDWKYTSGTPSTTGTIGASDSSFTINGLTTSTPGNLTLTAKWTAATVALDDITVTGVPSQVLGPTAVDPKNYNGTRYVITGSWTGDNYTYEIQKADNSWGGTGTSVTYTDSTTSVTVTITVTSSGYTVSSNKAIGEFSHDFAIRATSTTNSEKDEAVLHVKSPAPPKINGATVNESGPFAPGDSLTLKDITLDDNSATLHASDVASNGKVPTANWFIGPDGITDPADPGLVPMTGTTGITIPTWAQNGWKVYVKLAGNGTDVHTEPYFGEIGSIGVDTKKITVVARLNDASGTVLGSALGITVSNSVNLAANGTTTVSTTNVNNDYKFLGWSSASTGAVGTTPSSISNQNPSTPVAQGVNSATYSIGSTLPATDQTIYAVYEKLPTAALKVDILIKKVSGSNTTYTAPDNTEKTKFSVGPTAATTTNGLSMKGGATATITTNTTDQTAYIFLGWSPDGGATLITANGNTATNNGLSNVSHSAGGGSATFTMASPTPADKTLSAIYEEIPAYDVTIKLDAGVASVTVSGTTTGQQTLTNTTHTVSVRRGQTITVVTSAASGYDPDGFEHTPTHTGDTDNGNTHKDLLTSSSSTFMAEIRNDGVVITAKAKAKPALLTLSPTAGQGSVDQPGVVNNQYPYVTVKNVGGMNATSISASVNTAGITATLDDGTTYTYTTGDFPETSGSYTDKLGSTLAVGATANNIFQLDPKDTLKAGTYNVPITVTYNDGTQTATATTTVTYVVAATNKFNGKITVKLDGSAATNAVSTLYTVSGGTWTLVSTGGNTGVTTSTTGGVTNYTGLTNGTNYYIKVDLDGTGSTYAPVEVKNINVNTTTDEVEVDFYTVTVKLGDAADDKAAVTGSSDKVTLSLGTATEDVNSIAEISSNSVSGVIQAGQMATANAVPSNTAYAFKDWGEKIGGTATSTNPTSAPYSFAVNNKVELVAHMKPANSQYVITYMANVDHAPDVISTATDANAVGLPSAQLVTAGQSTTIAAGPSLAGYVFQKWNTKADGSGTNYAAGATNVTPSGNLKLYAVWGDAAISAADVTGKTTSYGASWGDNNFGTAAKAYNPALPNDASNNLNLPLKYAVVATDPLPGGLGVNENTGRVYGRAYQVSAESNGNLTPFAGKIKVTLAQDYHDDTHKLYITKGYSITVDKAEPNMILTVSNANANKALGTANYTAVVTGPEFVNGQTTPNDPDDDVWTDAYVDTLVYTGSSGGTISKRSGIGTMDTLTGAGTPAATVFPASGTLAVTATFHPAASAFTGTAEGAGHTQSQVWKDTTGTGTASVGGQTYTITVSEDGTNFAAQQSWLYATNDTPPAYAHQGYAQPAATGTDGYVTIQTGDDDVNAKQFTVKNEGNQASGALKYKFGSGADNTAGTYFEVVTPNGVANAISFGTTSLAAGATGVVRVAPKHDLTQGTYQDTLTITGEHKNSVVIYLTFVVDDPKTFDAVITVDTLNVGGTVGSTLPTSPNAMAIQVGTTTADLVNNASDPNNGKYVASGLTVGTAYSVTVTNTGSGNYVVPGLTISAPTTANTNANKATVTLYQVTTTHAIDPSTDTSTIAPTQTGKGWYVSGQSAKVTTNTPVTATAGTNNGKSYAFQKWSYAGTAVGTTVAASTGNTTDINYTTTVNQPLAFTAKYSKVDAADATILYYENAAGSTNGGILLATDLKRNGVGTSYDVSTLRPTLSGYVFQHWNTKTDGTGTSYVNPAKGSIGKTIASLPTTTELFAIWEKGKVVSPTGDGSETWYVTLPDAVYGAPYDFTIPMPKTTDGASVTISVANLPGGLAYDADTNKITGIPYQVGTVSNVTITATHAHWDGHDTAHSPAVTLKAKTDADATDNNLSLKVEKAQPIVTGIVPIGTAVSGAKLNSVGWTVTVKGPRYKGNPTSNTGASVSNEWEEYTDTITYGVGSTGATDKKTAGIGQATITNGAGGDAFVSAASTSVKAAFTPVAAGTTGTSATDYFDTAGKQNQQDDVWKIADATLTIPHSGDAPHIQVKPGTGTGGFDDDCDWNYSYNDGPKSPAHPEYNVGTGNTGYVTLSGTTETVDPKVFTLTNTGTAATGELTYTWLNNGATVGGTAYEFSYTGTSLTDTLDPSDTREIIITPPADAPTGTYTGTLKVTGDDGGITLINVKFVVTDPTGYPVTVETLLNSLDGTTYVNVAGNWDSTDVDLIAIESGKADVNDLTYNTTDKKFKGTGAHGVTYHVKINGYTVPNLIVSSQTADPSVKMFEVQVVDVPVAGVTAASTVKNSAGTKTGAAATASVLATTIYVVEGENATVTPGTPDTANKYSFENLEDTTTAASPVTVAVAKADYTTAISKAKEFTANWKKADATFTITYDGNGNTAGTAPTDSNSYAQGAAVQLKQNNAVNSTTNAADPLKKTGYTFGGWSYNGTTYPEGGYFTMPGNNVTMSAVWVADSGLALQGNTWTVAHKEKLNEQTHTATGAAGAVSYAAALTDPAGGNLPSNMADILFTAGTHTFATATTAPTYTTGTGAVNSVTYEVTATDAANSKTAKADYIINVVQAETEVTKGFEDTTPTGKKAGDTIDVLTDLTPVTGGPEVIAKKNDGNPNPDVNFDETHGNTPTAGQEGGVWTVTAIDGDPSGDLTKYRPGEHTYTLTFTPTDPGFKPSTTEVTLKFEKAINKAAVKINFPVGGEVRQQKGDTGVAISQVGVTANSPTTATVNDVVIKDVVWSGGINATDHTFDTTKPITLTVVLNPDNGWEFVDDKTDFTGIYQDLHSTNPAADISSVNTAPDPILTVLSCTKGEAVLQYTWPAEDTTIQNIKVQVTAPSLNSPIANNNTALTVGTPPGSFTSSLEKWVSGRLSSVDHSNYNTVSGASGNFAVGWYTVVVKATANTGFIFDDTIYAALDNASDKATINNNNAKILAKSDTEVIIAYEFEVVANAIVGLASAKVPLVYYAQTGTSDKHYENTSTTGNKSGIVFTLSAAAAVVNTVAADGTVAATNDFQLFVDMDGDGKYNDGSSTADILLTTNGTTPVTSYTFQDIDPAHATVHGSDLDGKNLYAIYAPGGVIDAGKLALAGALTVRPLKAMSIASTSLGDVLVAEGGTFSVPASVGTVTTTVDFNTDSTGLTNTGVAVTKGSKPTDGTTASVNATAAHGDFRTTYYYMLDVNGDGAITDADLELTTSTTLTAANHHNKGIYACYTDVNGNLVYTKVGTLKMKWTFIADIKDGTPATDPEYGDTLTGIPEIPKTGVTNPDPANPDHWEPDLTPGKYDYVWERYDPDDPTGGPNNDGWKPIPGATGPNYVPDKPDVNEKIHVNITDRTTGETQTKETPIYPRTITFDVAVKDKTWDGDSQREAIYTTADFTVHNVLLGDTVTILLGTDANDLNDLTTGVQYTGADHITASSAVGATLTLPAPAFVSATDDTMTNYTQGGADAAYYRVSRSQTALTPRGEIKSDLIDPIILKNDDIVPVRDGTPTSTVFSELTGETRYGEDAGAHNGAKGTWQYKDGSGNWVNATNGNGLTADGKFLPSTTYRVTVQAKVENDNRFAHNAKGYYDIGGRLWPATVTMGADDKTAELTVEFPPTAAPVGDTNVTYVTAFFQNPPIVNELIPAHPDWVGRPEETVSTDANADSDPEHFVVRWYESSDNGANWTLITTVGDATSPAKFEANKKYKVEVDVTPGSGYAYNTNTTDDIMDTYFAINTSAGTGHDQTKVAVNGTTYTMSYPFDAVTPIKVAHVTTSITQPVADTAISTSGTVVQTIGTDGKTMTNVTMGTISWYVEDAGETSGWSATAMSAGDKFEAGKKYKASFTLTTPNGFQYVNDATNNEYVRFVTSGTGPINGQGTWTRTGMAGAITKVTTSTSDADTVYTVEVEYDTVSQTTANLTDVYVNAVVPAEGTVLSLTGDPTVDAVKPYELTMSSGNVDRTKSRWQYWDSAADSGNGGWADITASSLCLDANGKFKAGYDYQVIAEVALKSSETSKYRITTGTRFYLAGVECTATQVTLNHGAYTPLVPSVAANGTTGIYGSTVKYTLTRQFSIPANSIDLVTVTYDEPRKGDAPNTKPTSYENKTQVTIDDTTGTAWYTLNACPAAAADFVTTASHSGSFGAGVIYMVEATITADDGYRFVTTGSDITLVSINGIRVPIDGTTVGTRTVGAGAAQKTTGWAMAKYDAANHVVKAYFVAETPAEDKTIVKVWADVAAPSANSAPATTVTSSTARAINQSGNDVTTDGLTSDGAVALTWYYKDGLGNWQSFTGSTFGLGTEYKAVFTMTTETGDGFYYKDDAGDNSKRVQFVINSLSTITGDNTASPLAENNLKVTTKRNGNSSYEVSVEFPATKSDTDVIEVAVNYTLPVSEVTPADNTYGRDNYSQTNQVNLDKKLLAAVPTTVTGLNTGSVWFAGTVDKNTAAPGTANGQFTDGDHTVVTVVTAKDGYQFTNATKFTVNGGSTYSVAATADHVVLLDSKTAIVYHTFPGLDKEIVKVITAVTKPVAGATAQSTASTTLAANKSNVNLLPDGLTGGGAANIAWTKTADGSAHTGAFAYSTAYTATFDLAVNTTDSYSYRGTPGFVDFLVNGSSALNVKNDATTPNRTVSGTVDGATVTLTVQNANTYTVRIDFPATDNDVTKVLDVHVNTNLPPVHGSQVPSVYVSDYEPYEGVTSTLKWQTSTDGTNWSDVAQGTPFAAGAKYRVTGQVKLKTGNNIPRDYDITSTTRFWIGTVQIPQTADGTAANSTVNVATGVTAVAKFEAKDASGNAATADGTTGCYDDATVYTVTLTFDDLADKTNREIVKVAANVLQPVVGGTIATTPVAKLTALNADNVSVLDHVSIANTAAAAGLATWQASTDGTTWANPAGTTFLANTYYKATFTVTADTANNYYFRADTTATPNDYVDFLINNVYDGTDWINGAKADVTDAVTGVKVTTAQNGGTNSYTVTVTFPPLRDTANVLTVWGNALQPVSGAAITPAAPAASNITVAAAEPYEKTSSKWEKWNGTAWVDPATLSETTFTAGDYYKATLRVNMKSQYAGIYRFTTGTNGYINDTTTFADAVDTTMAGTRVTYYAADGTTAVTAANAATTPVAYVELERVFQVPTVELAVRVSSQLPANGNVLSDLVPTIGIPISDPHYTLSDGSWTGTVDGDGKIQPSTEYTLTVKVTPEAGYTLPSIRGGYTWDEGARIAADAPHDNGDGTYTVKFTYTTPAEGVQAKEPMITVAVPVKGGNIATDAGYTPTSPNNSVTVKGFTWSEGNTPDPTKPVTGNVFEPGKTYTVEVEIDPSSVDHMTSFTPGYDLKFINKVDTLDGGTVESAKLYTRDGKLYAKATWTIPRDPTVDLVPGNANPPETDKVLDPNGWTSDKFTVDGPVKWYKGETATGTDVAGTPAEEKTVYTASITVVAKNPGDLGDTLTYEFNGKPPKDVIDNGNGSYTLTYTFPQTGEKLQTEVPEPVVIVPGFAKAPEIGVALGDIWTDSNFDEVSSQWTQNGTPVTEANAAVAETTYTATIVVRPKAGVVLRDPVNPTYQFNGNGVDNGDFIVHSYNNGDGTYTLTYQFRTPRQTINNIVSGGGGGGGTTVIETPVVTYALRDLGVTLDLTAEKVQKNKNPQAVPKVDGITGLKFVGWSETDPSTLKDGKLPTLVDPKTFKITKDKTFYAVYEKVADEFDHTHYVIGFPDGTFGPDHNITRGQVATIIARACLENFVEGNNYGNPGNYTDVESHWAFSAISYCSMNGVFAGYGDGTFRPDKPITRQELATVVARLAGVQVSQGVPFTDAGDIADWAMNGVYTNYANGWVNGYTDGTFKPLNDISRAETVKIFNGYLGRGVDMEGLSELREYVHSGVASNNQENGHDEYMTWPDVAKTHWAYYEIIEAANDHNFHWRDLQKETPPEDWDECYIDEKWRYQDDPDDGADDVGRDNELPTLTVTYVVKSNGTTYDSISEEVKKFQSPDPAKLPQAVPSAGFRFAGWSSTDPDTGVITLVEPDPTAFPVLDNVIYYAVFEPEQATELPKVTITYVIGEHGATDMALTETVEMWQSPTPENLPQITAMEGWRFAGWSETDPASGAVTLTDPTDHPALSDETFYACYEPDTAEELPKVTVTYVIGEHGTTDMALTETIDMWQSPTPENLPQITALEGWRFIGWSETDPTSGTVTPTDPTDHSALSDETFYALYEAAEATEPVEPAEPQEPEEPAAGPEEPTEPTEPQEPEEPAEPTEPEEPAVEPEEPIGPEEPAEPVNYTRYSYINGFTDNTFRPDESITRAAVAAILAGLKGYDPEGDYAGAEFDDLEGHWGAKAIAYCVSQGLMSGYTDNTFRPDSPISRQEFAVVLTRLSGETAEEETALPFTDVDAIASWAWDSVCMAYGKGWIGGYSDGTFLPERSVTRAEAVKLFNAYLGRSADPETIRSQSGYTVYGDVPETHWAYYEIIEASNNWTE